MSTAEIPKLRADARRNRERILAAAKEVFAQQGADAQMDDVARQAGVGVGTVYRHFPNKDVLMGELIKDKFETFTERVEAVLGEENAWEALCRALRDNAELMAENVAMQDALRQASAAYEYATPARLELERVTDKRVRRAQREGKMRKDFRAAELGMLMGGVCSSMSAPHAPPDAWRRHLEIVLDGLRAR